MSKGQDYWTNTVEGAAAAARLAALPVPSAFDEYTPEVDRPERTEDNACPECETGTIHVIGREYGQDMYACTDCDWES